MKHIDKAVQTLTGMKAANKANQSIITQAIGRIKSGEPTERATRHIVKFCHELHANPLLIVSKDIATRNVYAIEKCTKLLHAMRTGVGEKIDKYTKSVLVNGKRRRNKTLDNKQQNASMCKGIELGSMTAKDVRLEKAPTTASTQSSSTRIALLSLIRQ